MISSWGILSTVVILAALVVSGLGESRFDDQMIYECDFDSPTSCYISQSLKSNKVIRQMSKFILSDQQYAITDISSITYPTSNGLTCEIPFTSSNRRYYHCTKSNKCKTERGMSNCFSNGSFIGGSSREPFQEKIEINMGSLNETGWYKLSYFYIVYCRAGQACNDESGVMKVQVINGKRIAKQLSEFSLSQKRWNQRDVLVKLKKGVVKINIVIDHESSEQDIFYGFDHVQLRKTTQRNRGIALRSNNFECNFDSDECGASFDSDIDDFNMELVKSSTVIGTTNYTITDVSSIGSCMIPFTLNSMEYYHCTESNKCQNNAGSEIECADGNFLYAKIATVYESQEAEAKFSGISINKDGEYIIEYQTFIYCDNLDETECNRQSARDFIQVSLKNNGNLQLAAKFTQKLRRWTKVSHSVQLTQGTIDIEVTFVRLDDTPQQPAVQFGVDDLKVYINEPVTTATTDTTVSLTSSTGTTETTAETGTTKPTSTPTLVSTSETTDITTSSSTTATIGITESTDLTSSSVSTSDTTDTTPTTSTLSPSTTATTGTTGKTDSSVSTSETTAETSTTTSTTVSSTGTTDETGTTATTSDTTARTDSTGTSDSTPSETSTTMTTLSTSDMTADTTAKTETTETTDSTPTSVSTSETTDTTGITDSSVSTSETTDETGTTGTTVTTSYTTTGTDTTGSFDSTPTWISTSETTGKTTATIVVTESTDLTSSSVSTSETTDTTRTTVTTSDTTARTDTTETTDSTLSTSGTTGTTDLTSTNTVTTGETDTTGTTDLTDTSSTTSIPTTTTPPPYIVTSQVVAFFTYASGDFKVVNDTTPSVNLGCQTNDELTTISPFPDNNAPFLLSERKEDKTELFANFTINANEKGEYLLYTRALFLYCEQDGSITVITGQNKNIIIDSKSSTSGVWSEQRIILVDLPQGQSTIRLIFNKSSKDTRIGFGMARVEQNAKKDDVVLIVLLTTLVPLAAFTALLIAAIYIKKSLIKKPELVEMTNIQSR